MPELRKLQEEFLKYLTVSVGDIMEAVVEQGNIDRKTRLEIYQNAYNIRLKDCIEIDHPVLGLYLGDDLFEQMVSGYIQQHPSHCPSLRYFCNQLPDFLKHEEPFKSIPIIAEIAAFERKLLDVFDAADSNRTTEKDLQHLPAERWPEMKLVFHPSVRIFETHWNTVECWRAIKNEKSPPEARKQESCWILWRNRERLTQFRSLTRDGFVLYQCFKDQYTFADACELLKEHLSEHQIGPACVDHLKHWFGLGLIQSVN